MRVSQKKIGGLEPVKFSSSKISGSWDLCLEGVTKT